MDWKKTYPTLETMMLASFETLCEWDTNLPPPQTDVERTLMRRLRVRQNELGMRKMKTEAPELHEKIEDIYARLDKLGIKVPRP